MNTAANSLGKARARIGERVRELRRERRWTQAELAAKLDLSQGRYSEIERGKGSFTAEQFLSILKLFNAPLSDFGVAMIDPEAQLQNTLARLGAEHLHESTDTLPSEKLSTVTQAIQEALVSPSPRLLTATLPVLVSQIDHVNLDRLYAELARLGRTSRLGWFVENALAAIHEQLKKSPAPPWNRWYRRANVILQKFLEFIESTRGSSSFGPLDVLDRDIRTKATSDAVSAASSDFSKKWGIVTRLQPVDFVAALRLVQPDD